MSKNVEWNEEYGTGGKLDCVCDNCKTSVKIKFPKAPYKDVYIKANKKLSEKDWLSRKLGDTWYDFCSDKCFDEFKER